jgi:hypothetical protein
MISVNALKVNAKGSTAYLGTAQTIVEKLRQNYILVFGACSSGRAVDRRMGVAKDH